MNTKIKKLLNDISKKVNDDDFLEACELTCEQLKEIDSSGNAIEGILNIFEEHMSVDFGTPGPLVHFVETFFKNGYEDKLLASIKRKPTQHTLWMLNRVLNGVSEDEKEKYLAVLKDLLVKEDVTDELKVIAKEFYEMH